MDKEDVQHCNISQTGSKPCNLRSPHSSRDIQLRNKSRFEDDISEGSQDGDQTHHYLQQQQQFHPSATRSAAGQTRIHRRQCPPWSSDLGTRNFPELDTVQDCTLELERVQDSNRSVRSDDFSNCLSPGKMALFLFKIK